METGERSLVVHLGPGEGPSVRMLGSERVVRKVASAQTGGAYTLSEVTVSPGGGEGLHIQHREDECIWVIEGSFVFTVDDGDLAAGPGSLVYVPRGSAHAFANRGTTPGRLLVIQTPGGEHEGYLERVGVPKPAERAADREGRVEGAELTAIAAGFGIEMLDRA